MPIQLVGLSAMLLVAAMPIDRVWAQKAPPRQVPALTEARSTGEFVENRGQWDRRVRFRQSSGAVQTWITAAGVTYDVAASGGRGHVVRLEYVGADTAAHTEGAGLLAGRYNYIRGGELEDWITGVRRFGSARINGLYDGIDAVYYLEGSSLRYDLMVAPGADPAQVRMRFDGAESVELALDGALRIGTSVGVLEQRGLYAYQVRDGVRRQVPCRFERRRDGSIGFALGGYDRSQPLVIDPLVYSATIGGTEGEGALDVALGPDGSTYVTGFTNSKDFPTTPGAYYWQKHDYTDDVFVIKVSADGSRLEYATFIGSIRREQGQAIAVGADGSAYVTGYAHDFYPTTKGAHDEFYTPSPFSGKITRDAFVTKLSPAGDRLVYSTYLGTSHDEEGTSIAIDRAGNALVVGHTLSPSYPTTPGAMDTSFNDVNSNFSDGFLVKINPTGSAIAYSSYLGGTGNDYLSDVALDSSENMYVTGATQASNFPTTNGAYSRTHRGGTDAFVTKIDPTGSRIVWSTLIGGGGQDTAFGIAVAGDGRVYIAGASYSSDFPTTSGAIDAIRDGVSDAFVAGFNASGTTLQMATLLGSAGYDIATAVGVGQMGDVYVTGECAGLDFPTTPGAFDVSESDASAFVTVVRPDATALRYSSLIGVAGSRDRGNGLVVLADGDVVVVGETMSAQFPTTPGSFGSPASFYDGFVSRFRPRMAIDPSASVEVITPASGAAFCAGLPATITWRATAINAVEIALSTDGGATWGTILTPSTPAAAGSFTWQVPSTMTEGSYRIRIRAVGLPELSSISPGTFTVRSLSVRREPSIDTEICPGGSGVIILEPSAPPLSVAWEVSLDYGVFAPVAGETGTRLERAGLPHDAVSRRYRARVRLDCGELLTPTVALHARDSVKPVPDLPELPTITGRGTVTVSTVPTATDACAGQVQGTTESPLTYSSSGAYDVYWSYDDGNGNVYRHQIQKVIVEPGTVGVELAADAAAITARIVPNPLSTRARIEYIVPKQAHVRVAIHDLLGRTMAVLVDRRQNAGEHAVEWSISDATRGTLAPGGYTVSVTAGDVTSTSRFVILPR